MLFPEALLRTSYVDCEPVLASELLAHWEAVHFLEFVEAFIQKRLARPRRPQHVPVVRLGVFESICLQHAPNQLGVACKNLVKQFTPGALVRSIAVVEAGWRVSKKLVAGDGAELQESVVLDEPALRRAKRPLMARVVCSLAVACFFGATPRGTLAN